jgi:hypothetical protein
VVLLRGGGLVRVVWCLVCDAVWFVCRVMMSLLVLRRVGVASGCFVGVVFCPPFRLPNLLFPISPALLRLSTTGRVAF